MRSLSAILLLLLLASSSRLMGQDIFKFNGWQDSIVMKANTGGDAEFLNYDEKRVIVLTNLARMDGEHFAETILRQYLALKNKKSNKYTKGLFRDLQNVKNLPLLIPEKDLYDAARQHATRSGVKGTEGHTNFDNRYKNLKEKYMAIGENIYYGEYTAEEIVLQLLIDEGITDLGHRKNMLDPRFNSIGVSIKPHKTYKYNCVMSFGLLARSYKDYIH